LPEPRQRNTRSRLFAFGLWRMPEMQKKVFEMSRFDEKTHREIAVALSISIKTVETHISRALKFLRQNLTLF
jgi:RNA polymerase sigma factor (sigma-70 family)